MRTSKIISRVHLFLNRVTYVKLCKEYAYMATERQLKPTKILVTEKLKNAFLNEDWDILEQIFIDNI
jgi:hypothetical protein